MSVQVTDSEHVCLYCDTTDRAFGPILDSEDDAVAFLNWLPKDARTYTADELDNLQLDWEAERESS